MSDPQTQSAEKKYPAKKAPAALPPVMAVGICKAGKVIGLSTPTVRKLVNEGKLRSVRVGGRVLIPMSSLAALLGEVA